MKKIFITLLVCVLTFTSFAQDKEKHERIKALKIAFITERLELTEAEAQKFWPIYNVYETKKNELRKSSRKNRRDLDIETISEQEAKRAIDDMLTHEKERYEYKNQFTKNLIKVISAKKIILLKITEDEFNKRMLSEIRKRKKRN